MFELKKPLPTFVTTKQFTLYSFDNKHKTSHFVYNLQSCESMSSMTYYLSIGSKPNHLTSSINI